MTLEAWLLFTVTEAVFCFMPGPAVLMVVSTALSFGPLPGLRAALGILAANAGYFLLSATSIGAVLLASYELFFLVKWAGAGYLIYLGARMLFTRSVIPAQVADGAGSERRRPGPFMNGVITQGANPKAILFFSAFLPQFIDPNGSIGWQVGILGITSIVLELMVLSLYVAACGQARRFVRRPGLSVVLDRAGGVLLIGAGAGLALLRRSSSP